MCPSELYIEPNGRVTEVWGKRNIPPGAKPIGDYTFHCGDNPITFWVAAADISKKSQERAEELALWKAENYFKELVERIRDVLKPKPCPGSCPKKFVHSLKPFEWKVVSKSAVVHNAGYNPETGYWLSWVHVDGTIPWYCTDKTPSPPTRTPAPRGG